MAILHLMVGLPCSGKTTRARELEEEHGAVRLSPDAWHLRLFGNDLGREEHDRNHDTVEAIMWELAQRLLALGVDVILDFGLWGREERDYFRGKAAEIGAEARIHYMDVPVDILYDRLEKRNREAAEGVVVIPKHEMDRYLGIFQPPSPEELE